MSDIHSFHLLGARAPVRDLFHQLSPLPAAVSLTIVKPRGAVAHQCPSGLRLAVDRTGHVPIAIRGPGEFFTRKSGEEMMQASRDWPHPCAACAFYGKSVWQPVGDASVPVLARAFSRVELDAGQVLFAQGAENRGVFCVSRGLVAVRTHNADGSSTLLRLAYPGEIVGIRSFLRDAPHRSEARAMMRSRVCMVAHRDAGAIVQANPSVLVRLAARCVDEIDRNHERIIAVATKSNKNRLAELLRRLMDLHGTPDGDRDRMHLPLSRADLADLLGVRLETLSRLIGRLQADGRIAVEGREVSMPAAAAELSSADPGRTA